MSKSGIDPDNLDVYLTTGGDYVFSLRYKDPSGAVADWPAGTGWTILFDDSSSSTWAATVTDEFAAWNVDKAVADLMPDGVKVRWRYTNGTTDLVYWTGKVVRGV